jgi:AsmA protein
MSRWLKRLLVGGLVLFVLLGGTLGVLLATIDQQAYKTWLQDQVQQRYGRTLDIKGEVRLSIFPDLGLRVTNVVLSEPDSPELFASVNEANVSVSIKPLFQRKLSIDHVSLDGLNIKVIRDQHGKWNFNDLTSPGRAATLTAGAQTQDAAGMAPMTIDLHKLEVKRASIAVFDRARPWMTAKNLTASVVTTAGSRDYELLVSASLDVYQEGQAEVSLRSRIAVDEDFSKLTAKGSEIKVTKARQPGNQGLRQVELTLTADSLMTQLSSHSVSGSNFALRAKGLQGDDRFEWVGDIPSFQFERSGGVAPTLSGRLRLDGANALDAKYQVSGLSFKPGLVDIRQAKLDVGLKQASRFYKLEAETPVTVKADTIHASSARGSLHLADASLPAGGMNLPFTGELGYDLGKKLAHRLVWPCQSSRQECAKHCGQSRYRCA